MAVVLKKKTDLECKCTRCGCLLGYDEDDLYMGVDGLGFECPECGEFVTVREVDQNQWPDAFYEFGVRKGAVHIDDQSVQKYVNECIERLIYDHLDYTYIGTGDISIGMSRKCMRIIRQNIVITLLVKFGFLGLAAVGLVNMWFAIIADVGVMIVAVLNSARALKY